MKLRGIRCAGCGDRELVSVKPGTAPDPKVVGMDGKPLDTDPTEGWCIVCAPWLRGYRPEMVARKA